MPRQINGNHRSVPAVLQDIAGNLEEIARSEFLLAKTQIREEAAGMARASRTLAGGIFVALYAVGFLLLAAVYALALVLAAWLAALVVGGTVGVIALVLIARGRANLKLYAQSEKTMYGSIEKEGQKWAQTQNTSKDSSRNDTTVSAATSAN